MSEDTRFGVVTVLTSEGRETLQFGPEWTPHEGDRRTSIPGRAAVKVFAQRRVPRTQQALGRMDLVPACPISGHLVAGELVIAFVAKRSPA